MKKINLLIAVAALVMVGAQANAQVDEITERHQEIEVKAKVEAACEISLEDMSASASTHNLALKVLDFGEIGAASAIPAGGATQSLKLFETCNQDYVLDFISTNGGLKGVQENRLHDYKFAWTAPAVAVGATEAAGNTDEIAAGMVSANIGAGQVTAQRHLDLDAEGNKLARVGAGQIDVTVDKDASLPVDDYEDYIMIEMNLE